MKIAFWIIAAVYVPGFAFFLWINLMSGPVTPTLALLRALVWPIWWATGWPHGQRF
jgi:hypothetical protein